MGWGQTGLSEAGASDLQRYNTQPGIKLVIGLMMVPMGALPIQYHARQSTQNIRIR